MRKLAFLLSSLFILSALSACTTAKKPTDEPTETPGGTVFPALDVWDGTVAEGFAAGSGTEADPYLIATGAQLAYLAKSVNEGNAYSGKVIALAADVDLNDLEWTPIGNSHDHTFEGIFDGKEHIISNLSITRRMEFQYEYTKGRFTTVCVLGLFGVCRNATFKDLSLSKAYISVPESDASNVAVYVGILTGEMLVDLSCSASGIQVSEASIHQATGGLGTHLGGIIGTVVGKTEESTVTCILDRVQSFLSVFRQCTWGSSQFDFVGGIIGQMGGGTLQLNCKDFRSDLTLECPEYTEPSAGVFGFLGGEQVRLENGVSFIRVFPTYGVPKTIHAIVGENSLWASTVQCKNLFGRVMPKDESSLTKEPGIDYSSQERQEIMHNHFYSLYSITLIAERGGSLTEENCVACDALPENHGLDPAVWDLSDLANPKLK